MHVMLGKGIILQLLVPEQQQDDGQQPGDADRPAGFLAQQSDGNPKEIRKDIGYFPVEAVQGERQDIERQERQPENIGSMILLIEEIQHEKGHAKQRLDRKGRGTPDELPGDGSQSFGNVFHCYLTSCSIKEVTSLKTGM